MMRDDLPGQTDRLALMHELRDIARRITLPLYKTGVSARNKAQSGYDPVTHADIETERILRRHIREQFPEDTILGEEYEDEIGTSDWEWTLDPVDGTRAFIAGIPVWSTLIAVAYQGRPRLGLIDHPAVEMSVWGSPKKSWVEQANGAHTPLKTRTCPDLSHAILGCTEPQAIFSAGELAAYNVIRRSVRFSRLGLDAYGYSMVAMGKMDIIIEASLKPCDVRALIPVIEGAGGKITNWHGGSCAHGGQVVAVGDPERLPELYTYLGRAMDP